MNETSPVILAHFQTRFRPCRWNVRASLKIQRKNEPHRGFWTVPERRYAEFGRRNGRSTRAAEPAFRHSSRLQPYSCSLLELLFPYATRRRSTTRLLEQMPRSADRRASARRALIACRPLRSTVNLTPRHPSAPAKSKPGIFQNLVFVAQLQFFLRQLQRRSSHRMAVL